MSDTTKAAAFRRAAVFACAAFGMAAVTTPALADPIDVLTTVRVNNLTQPTTPEGERQLRNRIANAAEAACGSDNRSLAEYRYAVRNSQCFHDSYQTAMQEVQNRWAAAGAAGGR